METDKLKNKMRTGIKTPIKIYLISATRAKDKGELTQQTEDLMIERRNMNKKTTEYNIKGTE